MKKLTKLEKFGLVAAIIIAGTYFYMGKIYDPQAKALKKTVIKLNKIIGEINSIKEVSSVRSINRTIKKGREELEIEIIRRLLIAGIAMGAIAGNSDEIEKFFDDTVAVAQQICTAGDMRSISTMLDYEFMRRGRYPKTEHFERWMEKNFKENELKPLTSDHWENEFVYTTTKDQKRCTLISCGPDGIEGTENDIKITGL